MRPKCGGTEVAATLLFHCLDAPFPLLCSLPLTVPNCACSLTPLIRQRRTLTSRTILPVFTAPCHTFVFGCPSLARVRYVRAGRWGPFVPLGRSGGWVRCSVVRAWVSEPELGRPSGETEWVSECGGAWAICIGLYGWSRPLSGDT